MDNTFVQTEIEVIRGWEAVLRRPAMYLGKQSLFGLQCFLCGLLCAKSNFFFEPEEQFEFEMWVRNKNKEHGQNKSYDLALKAASGDDAKAFEVWADWLREFKQRPI